MKRLILSEILEAQVQREAWVALPRECCGLIEGVVDGTNVYATKFHATRNVAAQTDRFEIDPMEHIRLLRAAREDGTQIVGCYHSHPNGRAELSKRDRAGAADDEFVWLVAALGPGASVELAAFERLQGVWKSCSVEHAPELTSARA